MALFGVLAEAEDGPASERFHSRHKLNTGRLSLRNPVQSATNFLWGKKMRKEKLLANRDELQKIYGRRNDVKAERPAVGQKDLRRSRRVRSSGTMLATMIFGKG
jgi:hypothetical protein